MQNLSLVDAIGRLLTDRKLRERFEKDPKSVADLIGVCRDSHTAFIQLDPHSISLQAEGLIEKRRQEVISIAPKTMRKLGIDGRELFDFYADSYWPVGHRRHSLDAFHFLEFLSRNRIIQIDQEEFRRVRRNSTR